MREVTLVGCHDRQVVLLILLQVRIRQNHMDFWAQVEKVEMVEEGGLASPGITVDYSAGPRWVLDPEICPKSW